MKTLRVIQWLILAVLTLVFGVSMAVVLEKASGAIGDGSNLIAGWESAYFEVPDSASPDEAGEFYEEFTAGIESTSPEEIEENTGFLVSSSAMMLAGLLGFVLMLGAVSVRKSGRLSFLTIGGTFAIVLGGFWLFGFNLAYPKEFGPFDVFPESVDGPFLGDALEDDITYMDTMFLMNFSMWSDFLFQALFALTMALMILGLSAGRYRTMTLVVVASLLGTVGYATATCWHWGGGWLSALGAYDFAGSANIHVLAGSAALALVLLSRMVPACRPGQVAPGGLLERPNRARPMRSWEVVAYAFGLAIFLLLVLGANGGSVLAAEGSLISAVATASWAAVIGGFVAAGLVSVFLLRRSRIVVMGIGSLAGWAAIAGPVDLVGVPLALGLGAAAGTLAALTTWAMDLGRFDDPFGVVPISLVGGVLGLLAAGVVDSDISVLVQVGFAVAVFTVGFSMAMSIALIAWLTGWLWDGEGLPNTARDSQVRAEPAHG